MSVSVIIPTLNEEIALPTMLPSVLKQLGRCDLIVVDGGSTDRTLDIARSTNGVQTVCAKRGRASQMNEGARIACGDWLLFLHADTVLPENALIDIEALSHRPAVQAGCFCHQFSGNNYLLKNLSRLHNWRFKRSGIIYGDQALFIRRTMFTELGGFPSVPILEDILFSEKLVTRSSPVMLDKIVVSDSRKFIQRGILRSFLEVVIILLCHELKLPIKPRGFFAPIR